MEFDKIHKVKIETMTETEARAFIIFLKSEKFRHQMDIDDIIVLIKKVKELYNV